MNGMDGIEGNGWEWMGMDGNGWNGWDMDGKLNRK